jgi:hypothetical protein
MPRGCGIRSALAPSARSQSSLARFLRVNLRRAERTSFWSGEGGGRAEHKRWIFRSYPSGPLFFRILYWAWFLLTARLFLSIREFHAHGARTRRSVTRRREPGAASDRHYRSHDSDRQHGTQRLECTVSMRTLPRPCPPKSVGIGRDRTRGRGAAIGCGAPRPARWVGSGRERTGSDICDHAG